MWAGTLGNASLSIPPDPLPHLLALLGGDDGPMEERGRGGPVPRLAREEGPL